IDLEDLGNSVRDTELKIHWTVAAECESGVRKKSIEWRFGLEVRAIRIPVTQIASHGNHSVYLVVCNQYAAREFVTQCCHTLLNHSILGHEQCVLEFYLVPHHPH